MVDQAPNYVHLETQSNRDVASGWSMAVHVMWQYTNVTALLETPGILASPRNAPSFSSTAYSNANLGFIKFQ